MPRALSVETLALLASLYFSSVSNAVLWQKALAGHSFGESATWWLAACLFVALTAFQFFFLSLVLTRRNVRVVLSLMLVISALASHFMQTYAVSLDPGMLRNVLNTDFKEAAELASWKLVWHLAWQALLPIWVLWQLPIVERPWRSAAVRRALWLAAALIVFVGVLMVAFQDLASLVRNQRELRFLVTPSNIVYGVARAGSSKLRTAAAPRLPIATDAALGPAWRQRSKPVLFVIVVGETARAANWGLNGYARQTTPQLAQLDVINFRDVRACGTDTEVSVPCMFSPWGRRDYDEHRIQTHQSLLHVLDRLKLNVLWRDNQSGCKGVCEGLEVQRLDSATVPGLCADGRCSDEILLHGLREQVAAERGNRVLVLHQLGSHGPAYYARYPSTFRRFEPTCDSAELRKCTQSQIVNAYDNSLLYTDHLLAQTIRLLQSMQDTHDTAMLYVSDHGESLGEHNLFLHGMPYAIAPKEQLQVPMVMWTSTSFAKSFGIDTACLQRSAGQPVSHDHLFHTILGMLDVRTQTHDARMDLSVPCRAAAGVDR